MSGLRQGWLVAQREMRERSRSKAFLAGLGFMLVVVVAAIVVPGLVEESGPVTRDVGVTGATPEALSRAMVEQGEAVDVTVRVRHYEDEEAGEDAVRDEDDRRARRRRAAAGLAGRGRRAVGAVVTGAIQLVAVQERAAAAGIDPDELLALVAPVPVENVELGLVAGRSPENETAAVVMAILLLLAIVTYGNLVLTGVVEEKSSRVVEVLLARMPARILLAGKVAGIGLLGFAQFALTAVAALIAAMVVDSVDIPAVGAGVLAWVVVWFVLGYALYAMAYGALGSLASRTEDASSAAGPVSYVLIAAYWASLVAVSDDPDGGWSILASFFPLTAPFAMPARMALGVAAPGSRCSPPPSPWPRSPASWCSLAACTPAPSSTPARPSDCATPGGALPSAERRHRRDPRPVLGTPLCCGEQRGATRTMRVRVGTFNVRNGLARDGWNSWPFRRGATAAALRGLDADVVGLQEAFGFQARSLQDPCPGYGFTGSGRSPRRWGERCSVAFRAGGPDPGQQRDPLVRGDPRQAGHQAARRLVPPHRHHRAPAPDRRWADLHRRQHPFRRAPPAQSDRRRRATPDLAGRRPHRGRRRPQRQARQRPGRRAARRWPDRRRPRRRPGHQPRVHRQHRRPTHRPHPRVVALDGRRRPGRHHTPRRPPPQRPLARRRRPRPARLTPFWVLVVERAANRSTQNGLVVGAGNDGT